MKIRINCDGSCRGNGKSDSKGGIGVAVFFDEVYQKEHSVSQKMPDGMTNNQTEWLALRQGLSHAVHYRKSLPDTQIEINGDSKLVISQITGEWAVKEESLKPYYIECTKLLKEVGPGIQINHVLRHLNSEADLLANQCLDMEIPILLS